MGRRSTMSRTHMSARLLGPLLATALAAPIGVHAEPVEPSPDAQRPVDAVLSDAQRAIAEGRDAEAVELLEGLRVRTDSPAVRFYLADALLRLGESRRANEMLAEFLEAVGQSPDPAAHAPLVKLSAQLVERLHGWEPADAAPAAVDGTRDILWAGLVSSAVVAVGLGAVALYAYTEQSGLDDLGGGASFDDASAHARMGGVFDVAAWGAVVAGAAALGFGGALLFSDDTPVSTTPRVAPAATPEGAALMLLGRF